MSGHGANPIFFNKKIKIGRPEQLVTPHSPTSNVISFLSYQSGRYMCISLYYYVSDVKITLLLRYYYLNVSFSSNIYVRKIT